MSESLFVLRSLEIGRYFPFSISFSPFRSIGDNVVLFGLGLQPLWGGWFTREGYSLEAPVFMDLSLVGVRFRCFHRFEE